MIGWDRDRHPAAHMHRRVIGGETRRCDQYFVAFLHQTQHAQHDAFLHARRHDDLVRVVIQPVFAFQVVTNGLAQLGQSIGAGVVVLVFIQRGLCGLNDVAGRMKVRITTAKCDDVIKTGGDLEHLGAE